MCAGGRPDFADPYVNLAYDWLRDNGIDEPLPETVVIHIDHAEQTLRYTAFQWSGPRGWDYDHLKCEGCEIPTEQRTVPLLVRAGPGMLAVLRQAGVDLHVS